MSKVYQLIEEERKLSSPLIIKINKVAVFEKSL